jgi:hypothetical protein
VDHLVVHSAGDIPKALDAAARGDGLAATRLASLQARVDLHFDRLADLAVERATARPHAGASAAQRLYGRLRRSLT